jgi:hypothetical protein
MVQQFTATVRSGERTLHLSQKTRGPRVRGFMGSGSVGIPACRQAGTADEILFNSPPVNGDATDFLDPLDPALLEPF